MAEQQNSDVTLVLAVFKTHLDVGFTDFAHVVRQRYLNEFFPRAIAVASALREREGTEQFRWTTGSWILSEALDAETKTGGRAVQAAVERGDLCWHALPFTLHTEYCDRSLLEHGLTLSARLDDRFGLQTRAAKMTDVPGHTRGLVSVLAQAGVDFLHIGVNPAATAPSVPELFRWRDHAAAGSPELRVMYQPGGYGDVQLIPGTSAAVAIDLTGDNLGPHSLEQVVARFAALAERFPNAQIQAARLDDVADLLREMSDSEAQNPLPVVEQEIGDTWIFGVGSDPQKTAAFREVCRLRTTWLSPTATKSSALSSSDPALAKASTQLLLIAEHTWGMDQKTHWPELAHWTAEGLAQIRQDSGTRRFEASWAEQREYLDQFCAALERNARPSHAAAAQAAVAALTPTRAGTDDLVAVQRPIGSPIQLGEFQVRLNADGSVAELVDGSGRQLAGSGALGRLSAQTYSSADYERWFSTYNSGTTQQDMSWARWDNTKPGLEDSGAASAKWSPHVVEVWRGTRNDQELLQIHLEFAAAPSAAVSLPNSAVLTLRCPSEQLVAGGASLSKSRSVEFELQWFDKAAARWPESVSWQFAPQVANPSLWQMLKLNEWVSPAEVLAQGGRHLHCADQVVHPEGIGLEFLDAALVAPGKLKLLQFESDQAAVFEPDLSEGWDLCLYNNLWGTNFAMWSEGDARFRVRLSWDSA
ncbi:unannotated protein [freshwater metagenome]|uniref:Unannotated protein n=1 Tax=freshwater metagenome TaxID=449393 RepID=A0A6J7SG13_9ZZZZ|nr:DUF5054 domain-containing protein [Actinomycetota bacterium]